jgi:PqqD family protein of HPr-rel-A system
MAQASQLWGIPDHLELLWHSWGTGPDEQFAVFNTASGETHCLNLTAALVLQFLETSPASLEDITINIGTGSPSVVDAPALSQISELLQEFDQIGLIAPVPL